MSVEYSYETLNLNHPRSIVSISLSLLYSILSMIPFYYYLKNIVVLEEDSINILLYLPLCTAVLLFFIQQLLVQIYWNEEKIRINRDILLISMKSYLVVFVQYFIYQFFIFGYWLSNSEGFNEFVILKHPINRIILEVGVSLSVILFFVLFKRYNQQNN